ncbi:MAG TPA: hypothetical protein VKG84_03330 [Candidatus Acidoferrales bacterium]|nr:hypothetical protein [Candidatus Acidoferrales bacterium]
MRSIGGLLALVVGAAIGLYVYRAQFSQTMSKENGGLSAIQSVSATGVKNDLIAIAQAERAYQAEHGSYAPLSELTSSGAMTMTRTGRDGYTYTVDTQPAGFTVTARYAGPLNPPPSTFTIDQSMEIHATQ